MGYLFLTAALAAGITKGYCGKRISEKIVDSTDSFIINFVRMLLCIVTGFVLTVVSSGNINVFKADMEILLLLLMSVMFCRIYDNLNCVCEDRFLYMVETFTVAGVALSMIGAFVAFVKVSHVKSKITET